MLYKYLLQDSSNFIISDNKILASANGKQKSIPITIAQTSELLSSLPYITPEFCKHNPILFFKIKHFFSKVEKNSWIWNYLDTPYEKTAFYFYMKKIKFDAIKDLGKKKVAIIGCGGVGSEILKHLIRHGVKKFVLIDFDTVKLHNLNRQYLFNENDIGISKTELLKRKFSARASISIENVQISNSKQLIEILNKYSQLDLVINCADTPPLQIERIILEALIKKNISYFSGSVGLDDGSFGPFLKNTKEKKAVLKKLETIVPHIKYNNMCLSSFGPTNSIIADAMAKEILFFLLKCPKEIQSYNKQVIVRF